MTEKPVPSRNRDALSLFPLPPPLRLEEEVKSLSLGPIPFGEGHRAMRSIVLWGVHARIFGYRDRQRWRGRLGRGVGRQSPQEADPIHRRLTRRLRM